MLTKYQIIQSVKKYDNSGSITSAAYNTFAIWDTNREGKGIYTYIIADPYQVKKLKSFMNSDYFKSLEMDDEVFFEKFYEHLSKDRTHLDSAEQYFTEDYLNSSDLAAKMIFKPWFSLCDRRNQAIIIERSKKIADIFRRIDIEVKASLALDSDSEFSTPDPFAAETIKELYQSLPPKQIYFYSIPYPLLNFTY